MGSGGTAGRLSDPLRPSASSIRVPNLPAGVLPTLHQGSRLKPGASEPSSEGGSRTSPSVSRFLQPSLPRQEGFGVLAPHHRYVDPESLRHLVVLPHGDSSVSPELHPPRRLDDLPGPARHISSGPSSSRFASFSSLRGGREALPIQGPLLRSHDRASSLHEDYGTSVRHPPQAWGQDASLPGRLAHPGLFRNRLSSVEGQAPGSLYRTWHPGQPHEVVSSSLSVHSLLGHGDSISALHCSPHTNTGRQPHPSDRGVPLNPVSSSVPLASPSRQPVFPDSSRPGGMIRMRLLQFCLKDQWDFLDDQFQVSWSPLCREDLLWWSRKVQLREGVSLSLPAPDISFFSDASDVGWGVLVGEHHASGLWLPHQKALSINMRELLAVQLGLQAFEHLIVGMSVALLCDNTTTVAYLRRSGGTFSSTLNSTAREVLLWAESRHIRLLPQFIMGSSNVTADALSRPNQVIGSEWTPSPGGSRSAGPQVASYDRSLCHRLDSEASGLLLSSLRPTGGRDGCPSPALGRSPSVRLSSDRHHKESSSQTEVIEELRVDSHSSVLASEGLVSRPSGTVIRRSHHTVRSKRSTKTAPLPPVPPKSAYASADCMATLKRFAIQAGFSPAVAGQLIFSRRLSTRLNYQARWGTYRKWCKDFGHRSSSPTVAKVADFLTYMFKTKAAALSNFKGYRAMLAVVFKFPLPEISSSPILKDLVRSLEISALRPIFPPPPWDLDKVLEFLSGPPFEPLARASFPR